MTAKEKFTPALGYAALTPLYDAAIAITTRERRWRRALLAQLDPRPGERILDVGCGTGTLAVMMKGLAPEAEVIGLDPDGEVLVRARRKVAKAGVELFFFEGFLDDAMAMRIGPVDKISCSLVLHQVPLEEKGRILLTVHSLLRQGGVLHLVDYGRQSTPLMRAGFRLIQLLDGLANTAPNARGVLPDLMKCAGFSAVEETQRLSTATGSLSMWRAVK